MRLSVGQIPMEPASGTKETGGQYQEGMNLPVSRERTLLAGDCQAQGEGKGFRKELVPPGVWFWLKQEDGQLYQQCHGLQTALLPRSDPGHTIQSVWSLVSSAEAGELEV